MSELEKADDDFIKFGRAVLGVKKLVKSKIFGSWDASFWGQQYRQYI